jgi:hypothetical protein
MSFPKSEQQFGKTGVLFHVAAFVNSARRTLRMKEFTPNTTRPWKVVAAEVAKESNPTRLNELIMELEQALNDQGIGQPCIVQPNIGQPNNDAEPPANHSSSTKR